MTLAQLKPTCRGKLCPSLSTQQDWQVTAGGRNWNCLALVSWAASNPKWGQARTRRFCARHGKQGWTEYKGPASTTSSYRSGPASSNQSTGLDQKGSDIRGAAHIVFVPAQYSIHTGCSFSNTCLKLHLSQANSVLPPLIFMLHYHYPMAFHILNFLHAELRPPHVHNRPVRLQQNWCSCVLTWTVLLGRNE